MHHDLLAAHAVRSQAPTICETLFTGRDQPGDDEYHLIDMPTIARMVPDVQEFFSVDDRPTLEHSLRVAQIGRLAASLKRMNPVAVNMVEVAGLAHDLGKLDPEVAAVINNGRRLTPEERKIVNTHAHLGFERLYPKDMHERLTLRQHLGPFMGHVALDALFSHANARCQDHVAPEQSYLEQLVDAGSISEQDAVSHRYLLSSQILTSADVMDALLSKGRERAYREGDPDYSPNPVRLAEIVQDTIEVPAVNVPRMARRVASAYERITASASHMADKILPSSNQHSDAA